MFSDLAAAREALDEYFNEPGVELLSRLMHTAIVLEPVEVPETPALGASRIGGTPDLLWRRLSLMGVRFRGPKPDDTQRPDLGRRRSE